MDCSLCCVPLICGFSRQEQCAGGCRSSATGIFLTKGLNHPTPPGLQVGTWSLERHNRQQECRAPSPSNGLLLPFSGSDLCHLWICTCFPYTGAEHSGSAHPHPQPFNSLLRPPTESAVQQRRECLRSPPVRWDHLGAQAETHMAVAEADWQDRIQLTVLRSVKLCHIVISLGILMFRSYVEVPHVD